MSVPSDSPSSPSDLSLRGLIDTNTSWGGLVERERLFVQQEIDPTVQRICSIRVQHLSPEKAKYVKGQQAPEVNWFKSFFWVPLVIGDKYYLGNIRSIAKHTGLTSDQIKEYAAAGNGRLEREVGTRLKTVAVSIHSLGTVSSLSDIPLHSQEQVAISRREFVSIRSSVDGASTFVRIHDLISLGTPAVLCEASIEGRLVVDAAVGASKGTVSLLGFQAPTTTESLLERAIQKLTEPLAMHRAIPVIHEKAQAILALYRESSAGTMETRSVVPVSGEREMTIDTALTREQLQQVLQIAYDSGTIIPPEGLILDSTRITGLPTRVLITRSEQGEIDLAITSVAAPIQAPSLEGEEEPGPLFVGKGSFAAVTRLFSLATATLGDVFKAPSTGAPEDRPLLSNEQQKIRLLLHLYPDLAVMEPAKMVVPLGTGTASAKSVGYILPRYSLGSLSSAMNAGAVAGLTKEQRLAACEKLLIALSAMYKLHLLHGDIKPDNILVKRGSEGSLQFHFADFGDARWLESNEEYGITRELDVTTLPAPPAKVAAEDDEEEGDAPTLFDTPFTAEYVSGTDGRAIYEARATQNQEAYNRAQHRRDVYAMGCTISELLAGHSIHLWEMEEELTDQGYSAKVIQACKRMLTDDLSEDDMSRPMPDKALEIFQDAMTAPSSVEDPVDS